MMNLYSSMPGTRIPRRSRLLLLAASLVASLGAAAIACSSSSNSACSGTAPAPCNGPFKDQNSSSTMAGFTPSQDPMVVNVRCDVIINQGNDCGNVNWGVLYTLSNPSISGGWVVQEITDTLTETAGGLTCNRSAHFYEAFYVPPNASNTAMLYYPDPDDNFTLQHDPNSMGTETVTGMAKFYEGTLPADFVYCNDAGPAGTRRSTTQTPPGWDGTGTPHNLMITWDCTAGGAGTSSVQLTPMSTCNRNGAGTGAGGNGGVQF